MIKKIRQIHKTGCSVASLAMLLDIPYDDALKLLHPNHKPHQKVSGDLLSIIDALNRFNSRFIIYNNLKKVFGFSDCDIVSISKLKQPALILLNTLKDSGANHVVVWDSDSKKILDPGRKRNLPVSYYQKRLTFAIEIE